MLNYKNKHVFLHCKFKKQEIAENPNKRVGLLIKLTFMKKLLILAVLVTAAISANAQFKFGLGASLGTKAAIGTSGDKVGFGANARALYNIGNFGISGGFTYFIPSSVSFDEAGVSAKTTLNLYQINADAHYTFFKAPKIGIYGLGGLNYTIASAKAEYTPDSFGFSGTVSDDKIGVDLGAGADFSNIFVEGKYDTALKGLTFTVGYMF